MATEEKTSEEKMSEVKKRTRPSLPGLRINNDTVFTVFGLAIPSFLAWLGYWLMFSIAPVSGVLNELYAGEFGDTFRTELPERVESIANLGQQRGALYIIAGLMAIILAVLVARIVFGVSGNIQKKLSSLRIPSIFYAVIVFILLVSAFNLFLYVIKVDVEGLENLLASLAPYIGYGV